MVDFCEIALLMYNICMEEVFVSHNLDETRGVARRVLELGQHVVLLRGDLGAGKTALVKAIGAELGVREVIASPTFVLMRMYEISPADGQFCQLAHVDLYRLSAGVDEEMLLQLGELAARVDVLLCIEWPERLGADELANMSARAVVIDCAYIDETSRRITLTWPEAHELKKRSS